MTSITQNLPWFVRNLGVAIVGEVCPLLQLVPLGTDKGVMRSKAMLCIPGRKPRHPRR
jgi:hypothetical protein